jgi:CHAT domain-containing protein
MQLSGVLLAGANNAWVGNVIPHGVEDGILTADEISRLDLRNTKIAVLSACDTGLGDIDEVNGVFGLQRGLKMAGVKTIIMSLWKVPDIETSLMMTNFYRLLFSGVDRYKAFSEAVNIVRAKCPQPYYWAGFVMLD